MADLVRMDSNESQALLSHDDAMDNLVAYGWDGFIIWFEGFNLKVAQDFSQNFDGAKANIGDLQLEVIKGSISKVWNPLNNMSGLYGAFLSKP